MSLTWKRTHGTKPGIFFFFSVSVQKVLTFHDPRQGQKSSSFFVGGERFHYFFLSASFISLWQNNHFSPELFAKWRHAVLLPPHLFAHFLFFFRCMHRSSGKPRDMAWLFFFGDARRKPPRIISIEWWALTCPPSCPHFSKQRRCLKNSIFWKKGKGKPCASSSQ